MRHRYLFVSALVSLQSIASTAFCYVLDYSCGAGTPLHWGEHPGPVRIYQDSNHIACSSSVPAQNALNWALGRWQSFAGLFSAGYGHFFEKFCSPGFSGGNGHNEVTILPQSGSFLQGNPGRTTNYYNCSTGRYYSEADTAVSDSLDFNDPTLPSIMPGTGTDAVGMGRQAMMHELGHLIGLLHETQQLGYMQTFLPLPLVGASGPGSSSVSPFQDDLQGVQSAYGGEGLVEVTNLAVSEQFFNGSTQQITNWQSDTNVVNKCRGSTLAFPRTIENNSYYPQTFTVYLLLAPTRTGGGGTVIGSEQRSLGSWQTLVLSGQGSQATIPTNIPYGTYFLRVQVDPQNYVSELDETDNDISISRPVSIQCG